MADTRRKMPRPVGEEVPPLTDEQMHQLLLEGQALSKKVTEGFRNTVTIDEKGLSLRFYNPPALKI
ncbi:MAG: hypothetical protein HQM03_03525 [Magnetococcales bacterium]|nr:hypothetical protein [Magnetococcales bacterium]